MPPVKIDLAEHYKGDSWTGMIVGPILINDAQPSNALASVRMQFRDHKTDALGYELNTTPGIDEGSITISNTVTWEILVPVQIIDLPEGRYNWDFECTDAAGYVITTYKGAMKVKQDVTYG